MGKYIPFSEAYPKYVHQWHPSNEMRPDTTARSSNKKVLWQCDVDPEHTWMASPNGRFKSDEQVLGCPFCSGKLVNKGVNDLASRFPDVARQWSHRNAITPSEVHASSNKKFWWVGECGHEWDASVIGRTAQGDGCPICSGHRVLKGFNDLATKHPVLAGEWDDERDIHTVTAGSSYAAQWRGSCGHVWTAQVIQRTKGGGCPFCSGRRVLQGFNDLASRRPDLAEMWHVSNKRKPEEVTTGSKYAAVWVCAEGHTTKACVTEKVKASTMCPVCEGTVTVKGITDFASKHPDLAKQWVRGDKRPSEVRAMSGVAAVWRCKENHEWEAPFSRRAMGHGCPFCAGQRAIPGDNDLASRFPELVKEWHPDNGISPSQVARSSSTLYKWQCDTGHTWVISPNQRTSHKEGVTGCPTCWASGRSSAEEEMVSFIRSHYAGEISRRHRIARLELDVYLPEIKLAFEFNGVHWHSETRGRGKFSHLRKVQHFQDHGIAVIQVWEDDWRDRRAVVERLILRKIGADSSPRVGARTTTVTTVTAAEARKFLDANHIQGFVGGTHYDALKTKLGEVVAVMVTTHLKGQVRIDRYATSANVPGGFSRLLKVVVERARNEGQEQVVTFSDNEISEGKLYASNGFKRSAELAPDYKYLYKATRVHKFLFRKERFRTDAALKHDPSMTESQLASLNKLPRVWDSGKIKWELDV